MRTSKGCWTCRLRRKKCDETRPVCAVCSTLGITCHFDRGRQPEWMDGGSRQEEMAEQIKRDIKEQADRRRRERTVPVNGEPSSTASLSADTPAGTLEQSPADLLNTIYDLLKGNSHIRNADQHPSPAPAVSRPQRETDCMLVPKEFRDTMALQRSDTLLLMFYLENLSPFLFPFYRPSLLEGGRAWILDLMISSPVVRQATLCQSSYFFSVMKGVANSNESWQNVLMRSADAFGVLAKALQIIENSGVADHLHGAVRIMASIVQIQRFELALCSFQNWEAHHNAALTLFEEVLGTFGNLRRSGQCFNEAMRRLGPSSPTWSEMSRTEQVLSTEQAAFGFTSALIILHDVLTSVILQKRPRLYKLHRCLLGSDADLTGHIDMLSSDQDLISTDEELYEPVIDLESILGLENWVVLHIGKIAALDAWKQRQLLAGEMDEYKQSELTLRNMTISESLRAHIDRLEDGPTSNHVIQGSILDNPNIWLGMVPLVTTVWAYAAYLYLDIVIQGWRLDRVLLREFVRLRDHVSRVLELLETRSHPTLLRTMAWPYFVAGILALPEEEARFRAVAERCQPPSLFGTMHKAFEVMSDIWRGRQDPRDVSEAFIYKGDLVFLI